MLELYVNRIPDVYKELFPFLLMPVLWERPGYIPALTRLLQAYIERGSANIVGEKIVNFFLIIIIVKKTKIFIRN
jgi:hypothetical protein